MRVIFAALLSVSLATSNALAQRANAPGFAESDDWTYQDTVENKTGWHQSHTEITIAHAGPTSIAVTKKTVGFTMPPIEQLSGPDWSRKTTFKVAGWEDVTVPGGTFHAMKIEGDGEWSAVMARAVGAVVESRVDGFGATAVTQTSRTASTTASGRIYKAFWYVPAVKRWVKSIEEYYSSTASEMSATWTSLKPTEALIKAASFASTLVAA